MANVSSVAEIGVGEGQFTREIAPWLLDRRGCLFCIDPSPPAELEVLQRMSSQIRILVGTSFKHLPELSACDAYVMDGDHNYYTVAFELETITRKCLGARHPIILVHDIAGQWARRDCYFDPQALPSAGVHPYSVVPEMIAAADMEFGAHGRKRLSGAMAIASHEGGPGNGVLTAVEDFLQAHPDFILRTIPCVFGLGFLLHRAAPYLQRLEAFLNPWVDSPLLRRLEENRLALFEAYIAWRWKSEGTPEWRVGNK